MLQIQEDLRAMRGIIFENYRLLKQRIVELLDEMDQVLESVFLQALDSRDVYVFVLDVE